MGNFASAFGPFERLETIDATRPNRAHSEYLEYLLEAGALAPAVVLIGLLCLWNAARGAPWRGPLAAPRLFALAGLGALALHAILEYPLRNMALACVAGSCAGMLVGQGSTRPRGRKGGTAMGQGAQSEPGTKPRPRTPARYGCYCSCLLRCWPDAAQARARLCLRATRAMSR